MIDRDWELLSEDEKAAARERIAELNVMLLLFGREAEIVIYEDNRSYPLRFSCRHTDTYTSSSLLFRPSQVERVVQAHIREMQEAHFG